MKFILHLSLMFTMTLMTVLVSMSSFADVCDRSPKVLETLEHYLKKSCQDISDSDLATIKYMDLFDVKYLLPNDFAGLHALLSLNMRNTPISSLPENIFAGLKNLESLNIGANQLKILPDELIHPLKNLKLLRLDDNKLQTAPDLSHFPALQSIDIGSNPISFLPVGYFDKNPELQVVEIYGTQISELPNEIFSQNKKLVSVLLFGNQQLQYIPKSLFKGLPQLQLVWLSENQLATLPEDTFSGCAQLKYISLFENPIESLPAGLLKGLTALEAIDIFTTKLTTLPEGFFDGLISLKSLHLEQNALTTLPDNIFDGLIRLKSLSIESNQLKKLPASFYSLRTIFKLEVDGQTWAATKSDKILPLVEVLIQLKDITELDRSFLQGLNNVEDLVLLGNERNKQIQFIDRNIFSQMTPQVIELSGTLLESLPEDLLRDQWDLELLILSYNEFSQLPEKFFDGLTLRKVDLRMNQFSQTERDRIRSQLPHIEFLF